MDRILISLKKENGPRASSAPALGLNTIIFKHVYWYMQQTQVSVYRTIGPLVGFLTHTLNFKIQIWLHSILSIAAFIHRRLFLYAFLKNLNTDCTNGSLLSLHSTLNRMYKQHV